jgi:hypothetical protein
MMQSAFEILKTSSKRNEIMPSTMGECGSFGLYVTNKLKNYSSHTRNYAQHLISNILFSADQGEYEHGYRGESNTMYSNYGYTPSPSTSVYTDYGYTSAQKNLILHLQT